MVYQIVYCSRNRIAGSSAEVADEIGRMMVHARQKNRDRDVTGALMFNGEAFAQVLEGPRPAVEALYQKICADTRHSNVVLLDQAEIAERDFYNWSMAYSGSEANHEAYDHLNQAEWQTNPAGVARRILALLKSVVGVYS